MSLPEAATGTDHPFPTVKHLSYTYPLAEDVPGKVINLDDKTPKVFTPLKIGSLTIPNRIGVSPMTQYTGDDFYSTDYHKVHYGSLATRAPGLIVVESTAISEEGAASYYDLGLWKDQQATKLKDNIVDFVHAQAGTIGIQLNHCGRKALNLPYFLALEKPDERFDKKLVGPSPIMYRKHGRIPTPKQLTIPEIKKIVKDFGQAAKRAAEISNFDFVEIHAGFGFLITEFLSKISNQRTDEYGGSFENRIRFCIEVIDEIKSQVPKDFPVFIRLHGSDTNDANPEAWTIDDAARLAGIIADKVDLIDIVAGGNDATVERPAKTFGMFVPFAEKIRKAVGKRTILSTVGSLNDPIKTNELIEKGIIDVAFLGSSFLENPGIVYDWADKLGIKTHVIRSHFPRNPPFKEFMEYLQSIKQ